MLDCLNTVRKFPNTLKWPSLPEMAGKFAVNFLKNNFTPAAAIIGRKDIF